MSHQRTAIRKYARDLLEKKVDVKKIWSNRPSPLFLQELPCICVFYTAEPVQIIVGDTYSPKEYQRNLRLSIDIFTDEKVDPEAPPNENDSGDDFLDEIAWQVERAFSDDWIFGKMLDGYDPNGCPDGLLMGLRLVSTDPYNIDTDGERRILAQRLQFELPYETPAYLDKKYKDFLEYSAEFYRVQDGKKTEEILLAAEGKVRT